MPRTPPRSTAKGKAGIVQIARALGVSPSTVSRALRPETAGMVNAKQRKRILDLAEKQQFSPNPGARMLRKGFNATLSVVVPLDENIFFSEFYGRFLAGVLHAAAARSRDVHICTTHNIPKQSFRETLQYLTLNTSGIIYLADPLSASELSELKGFRRPVVLSKSSLPPDIELGSIGVPVVGINNRDGARSAVSLLHQLGHRRIGLLLGPSGSRDAYERKHGYLAALQTAGVEVPREWILEGAFTTDAGHRNMDRLLKSKELPTALCCASDEIAFGAISAINAAGLRCPADFSIVGFDDGLWATNCRPTLTTVRQPLAEVAERAVGMLIEAMQNPTNASLLGSSEIPASLVIRDSTRAISL